LITGAGYQCAYCFQWNETTVDGSAGPGQDYVEDCQVCCRPNVLHVSFDPETGEADIWAEFEG
jgi:hypothetical protein